VVSLSVRAMREGDLDSVLAIAASLKEAPQWPRAAYIAAMDPDGSPPRIALVAEADSGVVGFAVASVLLPDAELESIAVAGAVQRRGLGNFLLGELVNELKAEGVAALLLELRASNDRAAALYERAGFDKVGTRRAYYQNPPEDALLLKLIF
jgi:ribosomal-protein-alanine N-acetyltransferase